MRIGIHTSKSGSLERAALRAAELGANTFQIFSSSPRTWRASRPDPADIKLLQRARDKYDLHPMAIHDSYLINLASCDETIRRSSIGAFRGELERALAIGADHLVMHPGNCKNQSVEQGIMNVIEGLAEAAEGLASRTLHILLENTVGAGAQLGSRFEELAVIRHLAQERLDIELGFCLDTCHCFASGRYNVATAQGLKETVRVATKIIGLEHVHVIHTNDSKGAWGSHLDRHENIGDGHIGREGFQRILTHPKLRKKAFILETPVDEPGDDRRNLDALKELSQ
ncbi:MAG TPA: deoxyribonuclease IV [Bryobacteraceae bacterium]|nr:deoxyribonuclease IV [Bryobacteraceae bacterium]